MALFPLYCSLLPSVTHDCSLILLFDLERIRVPHRRGRGVDRRNIIVILLSVELMLNATNINFVAFSEYFHNVAGQVFVFFALTVAAAEVAVGLAIIIALHRNNSSIYVDDLNLLKR